jgi:hypothetical protein
VHRDHDATLYGIRSIIQQDEAYLCSNMSGSSAWVMLLANPESDPNNGLQAYAQIGYRKQGSGLIESGYHVFVQWTKSCLPNCTGSSVNHDIDPAPTGPENYQVYYEASSGHILMKHGTTQMAETAYNVPTYWDKYYYTQIAGETKHLSSHMPGSSSNKVRFYQMQRYNGDGSITNFQPSGLDKIPGTSSWACETGCLYGYERYDPNNGDTGLKIWSN